MLINALVLGELLKSHITGMWHWCRNCWTLTDDGLAWNCPVKHTHFIKDCSQNTDTVSGNAKTASRWVPHHLLEVKKWQRFAVADILLNCYQLGGEAFLQHIITVDETWVHGYELELKHQPSQWRHPSSPSIEKIRQSSNKIKVLPIVSYDWYGVILVYAVPSGATVNA